MIGFLKATFLAVAIGVAVGAGVFTANIASVKFLANKVANKIDELKDGASDFMAGIANGMKKANALLGEWSSK